MHNRFKLLGKPRPKEEPKLPEPEPAPEAHYTLHLTRGQAETLKIVCGHISGSTEGRRGDMGIISQRLHELGLPGRTGPHDLDPPFTEIRFRNRRTPLPPFPPPF